MKVFYASTAGGVRRAVFDLMEAACWSDLIPAGVDVLLKVNLTWDRLRPGVDTGPWVLEAIAERLSGHAARIFVGESGQILVDADKALEVSGIGAVCRRRGLVWHNFSRNPWKRVTVSGLEFGIPEIVSRAVVVSVPVVKTHYRTGISAALKNLYGCLDDGRHNYHRMLPEYIAAVNSAVPVALTVADGTVSLEGDGPKPGTPRRTDFVAASADRVALDWSLAGLMGFDPASLRFLAACESRVGTAAGLEEVCLPPLTERPSFEFVKPRPNFVARVEKLLRGRAEATGPQRDGPLMPLLRLGARRWYGFSYTLRGQRREALEFIGSLPCGPQWLGEEEGR